MSNTLTLFNQSEGPTRYGECHVFSQMYFDSLLQCQFLAIERCHKSTETSARNLQLVISDMHTPRLILLQGKVFSTCLFHFELNQKRLKYSDVPSFYATSSISLSLASMHKHSIYGVLPCFRLVADMCISPPSSAANDCSFLNLNCYNAYPSGCRSTFVSLYWLINAVH